MKKEIKKKENKNLTKSKKQLDIYNITKLLNENILKYFSKFHYEILINGKHSIQLKLAYSITDYNKKDEVYSVIDSYTINNPKNNIIFPTVYLTPAHFADSQHIWFRIKLLEDTVSYGNVIIILNQIFNNLQNIMSYINKNKGVK